MSEPETQTPPSQDSSFGAAGCLMAIFGFILLLPGAGVLLFAIPSIASGYVSDVVGPLILSLAVAAVGLWLIVIAIRGPKRGN